MATLLLLGALPQEIQAYHHHLTNGHWHGHTVQMACTGVGKVTAAMTTERLIQLHRPHAVLFTGLAGGLKPEHHQGAIAIGTGAIDAEMDVRAWQPHAQLGELPFGGGRIFASDPRLVATALQAPVEGLFAAYLATGSVFLDQAGKHDFVRRISPLLADNGRLPDTIDMEASAIGQVASAHGLPMLAIRAISDPLDGDAVADFDDFLASALPRYVAVVDHLLAHWPIPDPDLRPPGAR